MSGMTVWPLAIYGILAGAYAGAPSGSWKWFSYHPSAMMVSFVSLSASAAIVKKRGGYEHTKLHGNLMGLAMVLAAFGWYVIYSNKQLLGKPHLTSWHAAIGLVALVAYAALFVVGLLGLHPDIGFKKTDRFLRWTHKWGGRLAVGVGWISAVVGFNNMHFDQPLHKLLFALPLAVSSFVVLR